MTPHPRPAPVRLDGPPPAPGPVRSVYLHAPFCARRCSYCDFAVTVGGGEGVGAWLQALEGELMAVREEGRFPLAASLKTLYVGGGTPSLLGPGAMDGVARILGSLLLEDPELEWAAEANPESFTGPVAEGWRRAGVNRLSFGAQSFQEGVLRWMGRLHGPGDTAAAVRRARRAGIRNLSVDLIFGLPGRLERDWPRELEAALALGVPHISLYGLSVEPGTPLGRAVREGREEPPPEEGYREEFLVAGERLAREGYHHYELSNFALPGHESRHNLVYWEEEPYLGLGNSAHSYRHPLRRWNLRDWDGYQREARAGAVPVESEELLGPGELRLERIWLGLRTRRGVHRPSLPPAARGVVEGWVARGLAEEDPESARLTPAGWLLLDALSVELDRVLEGREERDRPGRGPGSGASPGQAP